MKSYAYPGYLNIIAKALARSTANRGDPLPGQGSAMQPFAHPSIFRHGLSRCDGLLKSTRFYYPAKIFRLLFKTVMTMIRSPVFLSALRALRIAVPARMQAPK